MTEVEFQILLVGGDPKLSTTLVDLLSPDKVTFRHAHTGAEALQLFNERPADLVLVDLESSQAGGYELLRQFKENPPIPAALVIALTAADDTKDKLRAYEFGALDCISKPLEPEVFCARLRASLKTKHHYDELIAHNRELAKACTVAEASARAKADFLEIGRAHV